MYYDLLNNRNDLEIHHLKWNKYYINGWGIPDKDLGGIEIYYLWKQFKPK